MTLKMTMREALDHIENEAIIFAHSADPNDSRATMTARECAFVHNVALFINASRPPEKRPL